ncbi:MAG: hypothetical protein EXX96DRAFT_586132 [Benjaminiella poitrasii]|nr:MAG: hypothetical protein EXX96DRAFT_586132 [Benjaminiella poitrasii]
MPITATTNNKLEKGKMTGEQVDDDDMLLADVMSLKITKEEEDQTVEKKSSIMENIMWNDWTAQQQNEYYYYCYQQQLQSNYYQYLQMQQQQQQQQQQMMYMMMRHSISNNNSSINSSRRFSTISSSTNSSSAANHSTNRYHRSSCQYPSTSVSSLLSTPSISSKPLSITTTTTTTTTTNKTSESKRAAVASTTPTRSNKTNRYSNNNNHTNYTTSTTITEQPITTANNEAPKRRQSLGKRIKKALFLGKSESTETNENTAVIQRSPPPLSVSLGNKAKIIPDSPVSTISSRQYHRHRRSYSYTIDPQQRVSSPACSTVSTASTASTTTTNDTISTTSSKKSLSFNPVVKLHETFSASEYDRRCDTNATCQKLTPDLALKIKEELNEFKLNDMSVHIESRQYTQFFA